MAPTARTSDPATSHAAAPHAEAVKRHQQRVLDLIRRAGPLTDEQLAVRYKIAHGPISDSGLRTRRAELVRLGLVRKAGEGVTHRGRSCAKWGAA